MLMGDFQMRYISRMSRINRRVRKARADRIFKEQSFNKQEVMRAFDQKRTNKHAMTQSTSEGGAEAAMSAMLDQANKEYASGEIFGQLKQISKERKFAESLELIIKLNVDPTQGDQNVRGTCVLPAGTGKEVRVAVFADQEFHQDLMGVGADIIGDEKLLKDIADGNINFDRIIATAEHMPGLKQHARVLGPKGLMPNVKSGTLVKPDVLVETVKESKQGLIEFRVNESAFIMSKIGKRDFTDENLETNLDALLKAIAQKKPDSIKGRYMGRALVKTSMGPTLKLDMTPYHELTANRA